MSFLSDLFEGQFSNLGTDISHAPDSAVTDYRSEWVPAAAIAGTALTAGILGPELLGGAAAAEGADAGLAAASDTFGAFSPDVFAAESADAAAGVGVADTAAGTLAGGDVLAGDVAAGGGDVLAGDAAAAGADTTLGAATVAGDPIVDTTALGFQPVDAAGNLTQDAGVQSAFTPSDAAAGAATSDTTATAPTTQSLVNQAAGQMPSGSATDAITQAGTGNIGGPVTSAADQTFGQKVGAYFANPMNDLALGLGAAPLALALAMGQPQLGTAGQQANQQGIAMSQQAQAALTQAQAGVLNSGQQAYIDQMKQDLTNQWKQTLFNMGVTDLRKDTRWPQVQNMINQQVTAQTATFISNNMQAALQEAGTAASLLTATSQQQMQAQTAFTQNIVNASTALAKAIPTGPQKVQIVNA